MNQQEIGKLIKDLREKNNLTQKQFASLYNVSSQAVSKWERGLNLPDITLLKQICNDNNLSLDEVLGNDKKIDASKRHNKFNIILIIIILILLISLVILIINNEKKSKFILKEVSTTCSEFKINGSAAYSKDKSSIYISNIKYCGTLENKKYKKIEYTLYEKYKNKTTKISSGKKEKNINLVDYLKNLKINVDNYSQICRTLRNSIYLELKLYDNNKTITYKIPLVLEDNCE